MHPVDERDLECTLSPLSAEPEVEGGKIIEDVTDSCKIEYPDLESSEVVPPEQSLSELAAAVVTLDEIQSEVPRETPEKDNQWLVLLNNIGIALTGKEVRYLGSSKNQFQNHLLLLQRALYSSR